tara:strand:- start:6017 stop:8404 length:2388 start_codon:yes stop_codon:yes gene_type:complete
VRLFLLAITLLCATNLCGQEKRQIVAYKLQEGESIKIDGELGDATWLRAKSSSDFTQYTPNPGIVPTQRTEVKFAYDDENIYVYAMMYDTAPDSILKQISGRDRLDNTDEFGLWISTYNDGNNAFNFSTNPEGVQVDRLISQGVSDRSWNAAWRVETNINESGWTAEFQIPLGQIRFTKIDDGIQQIWGVNFWRGIRRHREKDYWHPVDPARDGFEINDSGELLGLVDITPPPRLTLYPYVSSYAITEGQETEFDFNGGVDLKAGIGEAFTMDMTLIPDFGQVVADNLILNLSPYEVRLADNRPFFTEGTEIFNKTGLLYSRRIGEEGRLINATKISGRTDKGLGVGVFQAVTSNDNNGITSYSIAALDQNLPNNSFVHGISTLVLREGEANDALLQAAMFGIKDKKNTYQLEGFAGYNRIYNHVEDLEDNGYTWSLGLRKITGKLTFKANHSVETEQYNPNDIGYLRAPNEVSDFIEISYRNIEPTERFIRLVGRGSIINSTLYNPRKSSFTIASLSIRALTKGFQFGKLSLESQFLNGNDFFEPRIDGMYWTTPKWIRPTMTISTDYRKRFAIDIDYTRGFVEDPSSDWKVKLGEISPRIRVSDRLNFIYSFEWDNKYDEKGFTKLGPNYAVRSPIGLAWIANPSIITEEIKSIFARRDFLTNNHLLRGTYALSNKATIDLRVRHNWSTVDIKEYFVLQQNGDLLASDFWTIDENGTSIDDRNYNAWSVDLGLRWFFSPGSELSIVWKNTLYSQGEMLPQNYFNNWETMLDETFTNSLSFKALFFLDYNTFKR